MSNAFLTNPAARHVAVPTTTAPKINKTNVPMIGLAAKMMPPSAASPARVLIAQAPHVDNEATEPR